MARQFQDRGDRRARGAVAALLALVLGAPAALRADEVGIPDAAPLLRGIPLSSLTGGARTTAVFAFPPARRQRSAGAAAQVLVSAPPPPPSAPPLATPNFSLVGTVKGALGGLAIFSGTSPDETFRLRKGEAHDGWTLDAIEARTATLTSGDQSVTLAFPKAPPVADAQPNGGDDLTRSDGTPNPPPISGPFPPQKSSPDTDPTWVQAPPPNRVRRTH